MRQGSSLESKCAEILLGNDHSLCLALIQIPDFLKEGSFQRKPYCCNIQFRPREACLRGKEEVEILPKSKIQVPRHQPKTSLANRSFNDKYPFKEC